ncbi:MAG: hypothetical protein JO006_19365 [Paucibacter sp.]|nr:hypothetical protein [Roseateles sp.]
MLKAPRSDFWRVGIVPVPINELNAASLSASREQICWLPDAGPWRYLADPFGLQRSDALHVFVEAYDYRSKRANIERHEFALDGLAWRGMSTVLDLPVHLSYPYVFEHEGETWMLPESHQANEVALYRGDATLNHWKRVQPLLSGMPVADASLVEHEGRWWMFYALVGKGGRDQRELHMAHAPGLFGPWTVCDGNPLHVDLAGARPAGRPFVDDHGLLCLPVQDCSAGYGSATRMLRFTELNPDAARIQALDWRLTGELACAEFSDGLHTVSACGPLTLIDVKRIDRSRMRQWLDLKRRLRRLRDSIQAPARPDLESAAA